MRLAILMLNRGRGSGEVARQQAAQLAAHGHEVHMVLPENPGGVPGVISHVVPMPQGPLPVHEYLPSPEGEQKPVSSMSATEAMAYVPAYREALEAVGDVDLIIGHHANLTAIAAAQVAERRGVPLVLFLHGTGIEPRHHGGYADEVWHAIDQAIVGAAGLIVTTEYVRDELVRNLVDVPTDRFLVLACGVDLAEFDTEDKEDVLAAHGISEPYVICPGALTAVKGPQNVVAASAHYADLAPTIFIGDGELRDQLTNELGDRGRFLGFVSRADKAALISGATVLAAAPEKLEHFGIIYVEALAAGTVPVAYGGGGVDSIITPEVGVLSQRSPEALGRAIRAALEDGELRSRMADAGRARAEADFSADHLGNTLDSWLRGLVTDRAT